MVTLYFFLTVVDLTSFLPVMPHFCAYKRVAKRIKEKRRIRDSEERMGAFANSPYNGYCKKE